MSLLFKKFRDADIMGVRQYIEEGRHLLLVGAVKNEGSKNPLKQTIENFIAEFKVIETRPLSESQPEEKRLKPDQSCSLVETSAQQGYVGNVVSFCAGVLGMPAREFQAAPDSEETLRAIVGVEQILGGMLVWCSAQKVDTKKTKETGQQYTAKSWEPVPASAYARYGLEPPPGTYDPDGYFDAVDNATGEAASA